jgi:methyl-accepting chemotaxis protein
MSASLERMELCLAEFMSKFGERVGVAIDTAMNSKISQVFDSIKKGADALDIYSQAFNHGIRDLSNSGQAFAKASQVFSESDFASKFGSATISFRESLSESSRTADSFSAALSDFTSKSEQIGKEWQEVSSSLFLSTELANKVLSSTSEYANNLNTAYSELSEAAKQLRAARLAIGRENKQSDELSRALLIELDNSRPSREELMQLIQTISGQLQNRTTIDSRLTDLIQMNLRVEGLDASERSKLNLLLDTLLNASAGAV